MPASPSQMVKLKWRLNRKPLSHEKADLQRRYILVYLISIYLFFYKARPTNTNLVPGGKKKPKAVQLAGPSPEGKRKRDDITSTLNGDSWDLDDTKKSTLSVPSSKINFSSKAFSFPSWAFCIQQPFWIPPRLEGIEPPTKGRPKRKTKNLFLKNLSRGSISTCF